MNNDKDKLRYYINRFDLEDNLFDLMQAIDIAVLIMEKNKFPIKTFSRFKYKGCRKIKGSLYEKK